jgi:hypothetical protein
MDFAKPDVIWRENKQPTRLATLDTLAVLRVYRIHTSIPECPLSSVMPAKAGIP